MPIVHKSVCVPAATLSRALEPLVQTHLIPGYDRATAEAGAGIDAAALLHQFPRSLRGEIVVFMHREALSSCQLCSRSPLLFAHESSHSTHHHDDILCVHLAFSHVELQSSSHRARH